MCCTFKTVEMNMLVWAVQILSTFTTPDLPHSLESVSFPIPRVTSRGSPGSLKSPFPELPVTLDLTFSLLLDTFCFGQPAASLDLFMSKFEVLILSDVT